MRRVIGRSSRGKPGLFFNYLTARNDEWKDADLQRELKYTASYNTHDDKPLVVQF